AGRPGASARRAGNKREPGFSAACVPLPEMAEIGDFCAVFRTCATSLKPPQLATILRLDPSQHCDTWPRPVRGFFFARERVAGYSTLHKKPGKTAVLTAGFGNWEKFRN